MSDGKIRSDLLTVMKQQRWERNIAQLKAYIHSLLPPDPLVSIGELDKIELVNMISMIEEGDEFSLQQSLEVIEEAIVNRALTKSAGHKTKAGQLLGINDRAFRRKRDRPQ
jgi:DNA-binding NtrC family response regulator